MTACANCPEHVLSLIRTSLSEKAVSTMCGVEGVFDIRLVRVCVCVDGEVEFHFRRVNYYELLPPADDDDDNDNNYIRIGRMSRCYSR